MATRQQQRRGTSEQWSTANPILAAGEIGYETDTNEFRIGDGVNRWNDLSPFKNLADLGGTLDDYVPLTQKGTAGGVATLDQYGSIPVNQLPNADALDAEVDAKVLAHKNLTQGIHGISDTANLATITFLDDQIADAIASEVTNRNDAIATAASDTFDSATDYTDTAITTEVTNRNSAIDTALGAANDYTDTEIGTLSFSVTENISTLSSSVSDHTSDTTSVHGIADTSALATKSYADGAVSTEVTNRNTAISTHNSATTSVHGIADTAALATKVYADNAVSTHESDTTSVHGIADTSALATKSYADNAVSTHEQDTTNIHGIADTSALATKTYADNAASTAVAAVIDAAPAALDTLNELAAALGDNENYATTITNALALKAPLASPTFTGTVSGVTKSMVGLGSVENTADADKPVSSATQTALDLKANLAGPTFTGTVSGITKSMVGLGSVDNTADSAKPVSTAQQTALNLKANLVSPTFTGTVVLPAVTAGGNILPSTDNTYSLGSADKMFKDIYVGPGSLYVNGQKVLQDESGAIVVSADINENLGLRTSGSGNIELDPTGTGSVNIKGPLVVEAGANFSSADGNGIAFSNGIKSDSITSKTTNTDLSLSGAGTGKVYLNDNAEVNGNLVVGGNLTVSGTTTTVNSETISLADNIIDLNSNFTSGTPTENSGIKIKRGDSADVQLRWNEGTDVWEFTNDGTTYSTIAPIASPTFTGTVNGITKTMVGLSNVDNTADADKPVSSATQTALDLKAPIASPTFTGTVSGVTKAMVGLGSVDNTSDAGKPVSTATQTALDAKAPIASPTFTGTVAGITKSMVGLGSVDNTADTAKPISTATQTALDAKATLASPALTGTPTAPTASAGTNTTQVATTAYVRGEVSALVASAPGALDTLNELATALGNDASFSTTMTNALAAKAPLASPTFTGTVTVAASGVAFTDGTQSKEGVPSRTPIIQKTGSYTLSALTERDSMIEVSSASAVSVTIPLNSAVAYPVGTSIDILQTSTGQVSIVGTAGVTINAAPSGGANTAKLRTQWSSCTLFKRASDTWVVYGDLTA